MRETGKTGKTRRGSGPSILFRRGVCVFSWALLGLAGCSGMQQTTMQPKGDPLLGDVKPGTPVAPIPAGTQASATSGIPPLPLQNDARSTAAVVNNTSLPGGKSLGIDNGGTGQATGWQRTNLGLGQPNSGTPGNSRTPAGTGTPKVAPVPSQPAPGRQVSNPTTGTPGVIPAGNWTTAPGSPSGIPVIPAPPAGDSSALQASLEASLKSKGFVGARRVDTAEGVQFSGYVPNPDRPGALRYLETTAPDYATALQALLNRIEKGS